jgi:hypothetical protein
MDEDKLDRVTNCIHLVATNAYCEGLDQDSRHESVLRLMPIVTAETLSLLQRVT